MVAEGMQRIDIAVEIDLDYFAGFDLADEFGANDVEGDGFRGEQRGITDPAHLQRANAQRIAAGDHALGRHDDQRIGAFEQPQRIDQPVHDRGISAGGDEVNDDLGIAGRLEDRPAPHEVLAQHARVRNIAIVRYCKTATGEVGIERLDIAQARPAGGRIANMARRHHAGQFGDRFLAGEILRDMAEPAAGVEFGPVEAGDARGFLPAMLQCMEAERGDGGGIGRIDRAEHAALFAQLVAILV